MPLLAELRDLIIRHARPDLFDTTVPGVRLMATNIPTPPIHHIYEPTLAMVVQGAKRAVLGDKLFDYGAGQYLLVSVDLPIVGHVIRASAEEPFLGLGMALDPAVVAGLLWEAGMGEGVDARPTETGLGVSTAADDLLDPVVRLLRLLDRPRDVAVLAPLIQREILWRLLTGEQGAMLRQIGLADSRLSRIGQAVRWIRTHYAEILRVEELAQQLAMSPSSLHRHFRAVTAMSPLQYQKQVRLQLARTQLIAGADDVASVGYAVGYDSPSQFSREYGRLFGAPPGKDAARLRSLPVVLRSIV